MLHYSRTIFILIALLFVSGCAQAASGVAATESALPAPGNSPSPAHTQTLLPTRTKTLAPSASPTRAPVPTGTPRPSPTHTPAPTATLPASAAVKGMYGYGQLLPLSCEARSAADWARHFGVKIREMEFMARLPKSTNPEEGFVGSPKGGWGLIPPDSYGVHAAPVASVLRGYGAQASAVKQLTFDDLRAEIAAGRPVIVWVTGHVAPGERSVYRVDGKDIIVARYEHTVIIIGYDNKYVEILDGKTVYKRPLERFLQSWAVLDNMAIVWEEKPH